MTYTEPKDGEFSLDDKGIACWYDAEEGGWIAETEYEFATERMRKIIEAHEEFNGWIDDEGFDSDEE
jgi:hypothetical protein